MSIARADLRDSPILLLNEATSALDAESEHATREALIRLNRGRTTVTISHRLSFGMRADQKIFIRDGRMLEQGSPLSLMQSNIYFKRVHDLQFDHELRLSPRSAC